MNVRIRTERGTVYGQSATQARRRALALGVDLSAYTLERLYFGAWQPVMTYQEV